MHRLITLLRFLLLGMLLLVLLLGVGPGAPAAAGRADLLRLEVHSEDQRQALAQAQAQIYARLFNERGQEVLLLPASEADRISLPADPTGNTILTRLAPGNQAGGYFLVRLSDEQVLPTLQANVAVLDVLGPQAVVRASLDEMEALHEAGVHFETLELHTLREYPPASRPRSWMALTRTSRPWSTRSTRRR